LDNSSIKSAAGSKINKYIVLVFLK
jgi:hypothetical protein